MTISWPIKTLVAVTTVIALILGGMYALISTERGSRWLIETATPLLPKQLHYASIEGRFTDKLIIKKINYISEQHPTYPVTVNQITLTIIPNALFTHGILKVSAVLNLYDGRLALTGKLNVRRQLKWQISATASNIKLDTQHLISGTGEFQLTGKQLQAVDLTLTAGTSTVMIKGQLLPRWKIHWNINLPDLANLLPNAGGSVMSQGLLQGDKTNPQLNLSLLVKSLQYKTTIVDELSLTSQPSKSSKSSQAGNNNYVINWQAKQGNLSLTGQANLQPAAKGLTLELNAKLPGYPAATGTLFLPRYHLTQLPKLEQKVQGELNWVITDLTWLNHFTSPLTHWQGHVASKLMLTGTVEKPLLRGTVDLTQASFTYPERNLTLTHVVLHARITPEQITYNGQLRSQGLLTFQGTTTRAKSLTSQLTVSGNDFLAEHTPELTLFLSPALKVIIVDKTLHVTGNITVPTARILPEGFAQVETLPDDVVFVDIKDEPKKTDQHWQLFTDFNLIAGKDVQIAVKGLTGQLSGRLHLQGAPKRATRATGQLRIEKGQFHAYGQNLIITTGQLLFTNSLITNPHLAIRAIQTIKTETDTFSIGANQLTVGIAIEGPVSQPHITLFSDPAGLSQADILAYLLTGQSLNQVGKSGGHGAVLLRAAEALNLSETGGLGDITSQLKQGLGLSEIGFASKSATPSNNSDNVLHNTSLVLGKYLSPKLYVQYSIGVLDASNIWRVRYSLSPKWSLQTEASTLGTGADLIYTITRN